MTARRFTDMEIRRIRSETVVIQLKAGHARHNVFQIKFLKSHGSLVVNFPYGKHSEGLLSSVSLPAGQATTVVALDQQESKYASHKVKYTHHPDGEAHFSQDRKIFTAIRRKSVPLTGATGHIFTVQAAALHEFTAASRAKDIADNTHKRANLLFETTEPLPQAVKFVGRLYDDKRFLSGIVGDPADAPDTIGPGVVLGTQTSRLHGYCIGNPFRPADEMLLVITCEALPPAKPWSGINFQGGFDPPERFADLASPAGFLALSYPIENFGELKDRLGTVDYRAQESSAVLTDANRHFENMANAMVESAALDETADYLRRGRAFSALTVEALNLRWVEAFRALFTNRDPEQKDALDRAVADLGAELRLRDLQLPAVPTDLQETTRAQIIADGSEHPGIRDAARKFRKSRDKPSG